MGTNPKFPGDKRDKIIMSIFMSMVFAGFLIGIAIIPLIGENEILGLFIGPAVIIITYPIVHYLLADKSLKYKIMNNSKHF